MRKTIVALIVVICIYSVYLLKERLAEQINVPDVESRPLNWQRDTNWPVSVRVNHLMTTEEINTAILVMPARTRVVFEPGLYILTDPIQVSRSEVELDGSLRQAHLWAIATPHSMELTSVSEGLCCVYVHDFSLEGGHELYSVPDPFHYLLANPVSCGLDHCTFYRYWSRRQE